MRIKRNGKEYVLTAEELYAAHKEFEQNWMRNVLETDFSISHSISWQLAEKAYEIYCEGDGKTSYECIESAVEGRENSTRKYNTGDGNTGDRNTGDCNTGNCNTGNRNTGNRNTGNRNTGNCNTGDCNTGNRNTGNRNTGNKNTGNKNTGNKNTGNKNTGDCNTGSRNTGDWNTGDWNTGSNNTGSWNKSSFNTGCFMTEEQKIMFFNKPSDWTYNDWLCSEARCLLNRIPKNVVEWIYSEDMTEEEKAEHLTHETTSGYLKVLDESDCGQLWWNNLPDSQKNIIKALPNFDPDIFYQCTGIRTDG